jgi:hypothetical protein
MSRVQLGALGVLVVFLVAVQWPLAQPGGMGAVLAAPAAPPISWYITIENVPLENLAPSVAYGNSHREYLVVWEEQVHAGQVGIIGRLVSSSAALAGPPFPVVTLPNVQYYRPAVAYSTRHGYYLVAYEHRSSTTDTDIWAIMVSGNGMPGLSFAIDTDTDKDWWPNVTYNETADEFLIVYEKYVSSTRRDIEARRVRASDLTVVGGRNLAGGANQLRRLPDVAYNSARNEYLIAYTLNSPPTAGGDIVGLISSANLGTLGSEIPITPVSTSPSQGVVSVAAGVDEYLAVWTEDPNATTASIWGRRIAGNGSLQSFINLAHDTDKKRVEPAVAHGDAGQYMVFWRYIASSTNWDIYGRIVKAGKDQADGAEFAIDTTAGLQRAPAVGCNLVGRCLVVYEDNYPGTAGNEDYNITGRLVGHQRAFLPLVAK